VPRSLQGLADAIHAAAVAGNAAGSAIRLVDFQVGADHRPAALGLASREAAGTGTRCLATDLALVAPHAATAAVSGAVLSVRADGRVPALLGVLGAGASAGDADASARALDSTSATVEGVAVGDDAGARAGRFSVRAGVAAAAYRADLAAGASGVAVAAVRGIL